MKYSKRISVLFILFFGILLVAVSKPITIKGQLTYKGANSRIYLYKYLGATIFPFDSTHFKSGSFEFKYHESLPRGFYKIGFDKESAITLILGTENIVISGNPEIARSIVISGSKENDIYKAYQKINQLQNEQNTQLTQTAQKMQQEPGMTEELYNSRVGALKLKQDSLSKAFTKSYQALTDPNPTLFITKVISMFSLEGKTADTYFSSGEFTDKEYAAGDMLPFKIQMYFQYYLKQDLNEWKAGSENLLSKCTAGSDNKQVFYAGIVPLFVQNDLEFAKNVLNRFTVEFPNSISAKDLKATMPKGAPTVGDLAPDITLMDYSGAVHSLASLKGNVVLLDFWASWCGPCRAENPNVVSAYNTYKDKGFTVFSVSLDSNKDQWIAAIQKDGLIWPSHVSDLKGWKSDPAQLYSVRGIPSTFLIDKDGKVVATNLRGPDLHAKLEELLNKP